MARPAGPAAPPAAASRPANHDADPGVSRAAPAALLLLGLLFAQGLVFIGEASQTSDEAVHVAAGYSYLKTADFRLNPEHPPLIKEIAALPLLALDLDFPWGPLWETGEQWNLGRLFVHENRLPNDTILLAGRLPILALSLILGWCLFRRGRRLFGTGGGLLALALYVLDPNVVAHSSLITTDLGVTLFIFLAVMALRDWAERPAPRALVLLGAASGAAFASKFTGLWLLPILGVLVLGLVLLGTPFPERPWTGRSPLVDASASWRRRAAAVLKAALVAGAVAVAVVLLTYAVVGAPAYVTGLLRGLRHSTTGHMAYLMGDYSDTGWWYYFLVAFLLKTPIGTLVVVALAIAAAGLGARTDRREEMFLWVPALVVVAITCVWKVNIGLRHLLPAYPFLFLACGRLASPLIRRLGAAPARRALPYALAGCLGWNLLAAVRIAPHHLAYFNELAGGPSRGHLSLLDSNLDWGQAARALRRFVVAEKVPVIYCAFSGNSDPWYYGVPYQYAPGSGNLDNALQRGVRMPDDAPRELLAISAMVLHSVQFTDPTLYAWLRGRKPVATPGYAYFVYDITGDVETHSYLSVLYINFGLLDLAEFEARRTLRLAPDNELAAAVIRKLDELRAAAPETGAPG